MNMGILKKIWGGGITSCLGIDIGATSIKVVELAQENRIARLINYGTIALSNYDRSAGTLRANPSQLFEVEAAHYLKLLLEMSGMRARNAVASLPSFAVFSTILDLPPMPEKEIAQALQFKARQYIPLPISSVSLDWVRVAEQKVLLLAIPNELIQKYTALCGEAGLHLIALEAEGVSFARALYPQSPASHGPILVIDIGARSTGLFVVAEGVLQLMEQTDFSSVSLTHSIASGLGIALSRAEDLKREQGIMKGGGASDELSTLLVVLVDGILNSAKRLRERFIATYGKDVQSVAFAGGGAHLPGLLEYAAQKFGLPVTKARPLSCAYPVASEAALMPLGPELTIAAGAALRGMI